MSYCGLGDARISASEKDLPVQKPNADVDQGEDKCTDYKSER